MLHISAAWHLRAALLTLRDVVGVASDDRVSHRTTGRIFLGHCDPRVHEFSDLAHSDQACVEGGDDKLLEALEAGPSTVIEKGRVFKDLPTLMRWLQ